MKLFPGAAAVQSQPRHQHQHQPHRSQPPADNFSISALSPDPLWQGGARPRAAEVRQPRVGALQMVTRVAVDTCGWCVGSVVL